MLLIGYVIAALLLATNVNSRNSSPPSLAVTAAGQ